MLATIEALQNAGYTEQVFSDADLSRLWGGSAAKRYGLVNKALAKGELIRLRRGLYIVHFRFRKQTFSNYFLANRIVPGSYVSFESALSYHGWIPEKVTMVMSALNDGRSKEFANKLSVFTYTKLSFNEYDYYSGVTRYMDHKPYFIATPLRALADMVYKKKLEWEGLTFLLDGMRLDEEKLLKLRTSDFHEVLQAHKSKRVISYLSILQKEIAK